MELKKAPNTLDESHFGERELFKEFELDAFGDVAILDDLIEARNDVKGVVAFVPKFVGKFSSLQTWTLLLPSRTLLPEPW